MELGRFLVLKHTEYDYLYDDIHFVCFILFSVSKPTRQMMEEHYSEQRHRPFYEEIVTFMTSNRVVAMVWRGPMVIKVVRKMIGKFSPDAEPGTIRGDFSLDATHNIIHASDSTASAQKEINLWFKYDELIL